MFSIDFPEGGSADYRTEKAAVKAATQYVADFPKSPNPFNTYNVLTTITIYKNDKNYLIVNAQGVHGQDGGF